MTFSRYFKDAQTPEWKRAYLDYRLLRRRINAIRRVRDGYADSSTADESLSDDEPYEPEFPRTIRELSPGGIRDSSMTPVRTPTSTPAITKHAKSLPSPNTARQFNITPSHSGKLTFQDILFELMPKELAFFATLDMQLNKIDRFYQEREAELQARREVLLQQLEELGEHRMFLQAAYEPRAWTTKMRHKLISVVQPRAQLRSETSYRIELSLRLEGIRKGSEKRPEDLEEIRTPTFSLDTEDYLHAKKKLKTAVLEHYRGLELLYNYRVLNITGFRKVLKKFEKATNIPAQQPYMSERVDQNAFAMDESLRARMEEMESLYMVKFASNDRKQALNRLKAGSLVKSHYSSIFMSGMLLGLAVVPLFMGIWASQKEWTHDEIPAWDGLLFIYSILGMPLLFSAMVGLNLVGWARYRINYGFIFELDSRTHLDYREYWEIPSILIVTFSCALGLSFFRIASDTVSPTTWPLIWLAFCLCVMVNPLPIFARSSRYWLLWSIGKLLLSGTRPVEFIDFWMADQFCSLGFTLSNLTLIACVYGTGFDTEWGQCGGTWRFWPVSFLLGTLPLVVRLIQSVKRYLDSGLKTHLINGGKYASGVVSFAFLCLWKNEAGRERGWIFVGWCLTSCLYSIYASLWDFWMDWSLLRVRAKHWLLRQELIYTDRIPLYYFAIISNVLIRFIWVIYIPKRGPDMTLRAFIAGLLEIFRRWQWNFYRLENEHLGNVDQYRATREVPLPYTCTVVEDDDMHDQEMRELRQTSRKSAKRPNSRCRSEWVSESSSS